MPNELSFDGCGINGPDEYRTRLATFAIPRGDDARKFGPMFAASPDMLAAMVTIADRLESMAEHVRKLSTWTPSEADSQVYREHARDLFELARIARDSMPK